jgi:hypothetical protein
MTNLSPLKPAPPRNCFDVDWGRPVYNRSQSGMRAEAAHEARVASINICLCCGVTGSTTVKHTGAGPVPACHLCTEKTGKNHRKWRDQFRGLHRTGQHLRGLRSTSEMRNYIEMIVNFGSAPAGYLENRS